MGTKFKEFIGVRIEPSMGLLLCNIARAKGMTESDLVRDILKESVKNILSSDPDLRNRVRQLNRG